VSGGWVALSVVAPFATLLCWLPVSVWRGQRRCDRLNAARDAHAAAWGQLTADDRAWLLANGGTRPTSMRWEMR
jgi:uncharacterized membrane protein